MKIINASIKVAERDRRSGRMIGLDGCVIEFHSEDTLKQNDKLKMCYEKEVHYFSVNEIEIADNNKLLIRASEVGYWARAFRRKEGFDIRKLLNIEVEVVTDKETLSKISLESCWC
jgi:hypothetical protein